MPKKKMIISRFIYPEDTKADKPKTRAECKNIERPCPYVSCKYHLYLDVEPNGSLRLNFDGEIEDMEHTCVLDIADKGPQTLEDISTNIGMTVERARQLEVSGLHKLQDNKTIKEWMEP